MWLEERAFLDGLTYSEKSHKTAGNKMHKGELIRYSKACVSYRDCFNLIKIE